MASEEGWAPQGFWAAAWPSSPLCLVYFNNYILIQKKLIFSNNSKIERSGLNILIKKKVNTSTSSNSLLLGSKNNIRLWPFTLNNVPSLLRSVTTSCDDELTTSNDPSHLLWSFPCPKSFTLELESNTLSPRVNSFLILLPCHLFTISL